MAAIVRPARVAFFAGFLLAAWLAFSGVAQAQSANTEVRRIADKLQCPVCQGTSVADSPSAVADSMRSEIRARLEQGQS
ncbi:MAG: cytochrome C biogenesis protein, partial [Dehalococcoidia bacterium]|nr:cytochrome C biogenesis protein [Dehalococcoidia bacterium]